MGYKIGSFNMRNLGLASMGKDNLRDLKLIAEIIREERFDVVALQEVLSEGKAFISPDYTKKCILMELGGEREWGFEWADASSKTADKRGEGYAFLWNKRRLRLTTTKLENGSIREFKPRMLNNVKSRVMRRYPYYARFTPQGTLEGTNFEIRLICIHTHYGDNTSEDREIRRNELDIVMKEIYPQISDRIYRNDMPHYTIILGDYNVELRRGWKDDYRKKQNIELALQGKKPIPLPDYLKADANDEIEIVKWGPMRKIKTVQDQLTTLKSLKSIESGKVDFEGRGYSYDYDHFSFETAQFEGIKWSVKRIDAVRKYCNDDFSEYLKKVSDHIPIMMEINLK